jgi:hypothetical protein
MFTRLVCCVYIDDTKRVIDILDIVIGVKGTKFFVEV